MKEKNAYIFFNCDEEKSQKSMNLFYNKEIYRDLKLARRALYAKIEEEPAIREAILSGDPTKASDYIQYGIIEAFPIV